MTTSHLRFGPNPIRSTYLITRASFVACHNFSFLEKMNVVEAAMPGAVFLLNSPYSAAEVWDHLPKTTQQEMLRKKIEFYVIDGYKVALGSLGGCILSAGNNRRDRAANTVGVQGRTAGELPGGASPVGSEGIPANSGKPAAHAVAAGSRGVGSSARPANHRWPVVTGMLAALIAVVAGAVYYRSLPPHDFGLQAYAIAPGQIRISWNHGAVPAVEGASGAIEIRDGEDDTQILLDAAQQRISSLTYTQKTNRVEVTLRVSRRDAAPLEDSLEFLGPPAHSAATEPPIQVLENGQALPLASHYDLSAEPPNAVPAGTLRKVAEPAPSEPLRAPADSAKRKFQPPEVAAVTAAVKAPVLSAPRRCRPR